MKRILLTAVMCLLSFAVSAQVDKYKITFISEGTVLIGPISELKEYKEGDLVQIGPGDFLFFKKAGSDLKLLNIKTREYFEVTDREYSTSGSELNAFLQSKVLATKGSSDKVFYLVDTLYFKGLGKGSSIEISGKKTILPYDSQLGSYVIPDMFPYENNEGVTLYSRKNEIYAYPFRVVIHRRQKE